MMVLILTEDLYIPVEELRVSSTELDIVDGPKFSLKGGKTYRDIFEKIKKAIEANKAYVDLRDFVIVDNSQVLAFGN